MVAATAPGKMARTQREAGEGLALRYTVADSPVGRVLVAATACGVSAVLLGEDDAELERALAAEFPRATISRDDAALRDAALAIVALTAGDAHAAPVPLDLQGTAFQRRVWTALAGIRPGSTAAYAEIARTIGAPSSVRAVAGACARNHAALVVPCHRVVRTDGGLGGYRWGVERKRRILANEGVTRANG